MSVKRKQAPETPHQTLARHRNVIPAGTWDAKPHVGTIKIDGVPMLQADATLISYVAWLHRNAAAWTNALETLRDTERKLNRAISGIEKIGIMESLELLREIQASLSAAGYTLD